MQARITVIKKAFHQDIIAEYCPERVGKVESWSVFDDGRSFVVDGPVPSMPWVFCPWAWSDIHKVVALTMMGASPTPGTEFTCCSDGLRPVTFRIQRIEE